LVLNKRETVVRLWPADLPKQGAYRELRQLSRVLDVPLPSITRQIEERRGDPITPVILSVGVNERLVDFLEERPADFPGVGVFEPNRRESPGGMLASQLLGYVGEINQQELDARKKGGFRPGDRVGQTGLESSYDAYLRGRPGLAELRVDSLGKPTS